VKNLGLKIFSLIAALALNYYVNSENHIAVVGFSAPIKVSNIPDDRILVYPLTPSVDVTIKGPSYLVSQVVTSNMMYDLTLPQQVGNSYRTGLLKSALNLPPSIEVVSIEPAEIDLSFDRKIEREIPVIIPRYGTTPDNFKFVSMEVVPPSIKVTGPELELKKVKSIETSPVDFRDATESFSKKLTVRTPGSLMSVEPDSVVVKVQIAGLVASRTLQNVPLEVRGSVGIAYELSTESVTFEFAGPASTTEAIKSDFLVPYVKLGSGVKVGDTLPVNLELPEGISLKSLTPDKVTIKSLVRTNGK
jgi:YbbR domain-containing protein